MHAYIPRPNVQWGFGVESNTHPNIVFLPPFFLMSFHCIISSVCPPDNNNFFWFFWVFFGFFFFFFCVSHKNLEIFLINFYFIFFPIFSSLKWENSPPKKSNTPQQQKIKIKICDQCFFWGPLIDLLILHN